MQKQTFIGVLQKSNLKIFKNFPGKHPQECEMVKQYEFAAFQNCFSLADTFLSIFLNLSKLPFPRTVTDDALFTPAGPKFWKHKKQLFLNV